MTKLNLSVILIITLSSLFRAQVGIGTSIPDNSAILQLNSTNKGFLPPKIPLISATDATTIPTPANGLVVYNTSTTFGTQGLYLNVGTPAAPSWRALQMQAAGGPIIEYNKIVTAPTPTDFNALTNNNVNWTEITALRSSFTASAGANINVTLSGMVDVSNATPVALQADYLIKITPGAALSSSIPYASNGRNGFLISTTSSTSSPGVFGSAAITYSSGITAPAADTYFVQAYVARSNTPTNSNIWLASNWSVNMFVTK
ncbi:hypothetical protein GCM10022217_15060 [Chryseobacterium ginsenosidimutans]|uniref:hypothetical protein n=1 Tax=Chryseobacterium ginsenosidimutans TaxID=687846 RepID=UPI0031DE87B1